MNKRIVQFQRIYILAHEDRLWMDSLLLYSFPFPSLLSPFVLLLSYNSIIGWSPLSDLLHYFIFHISFIILLFSFSNLAFSDLTLSNSDSTILFFILDRMNTLLTFRFQLVLFLHVTLQLCLYLCSLLLISTVMK